MFLGEHESYFYDSDKQKHMVLFSNLVTGIDAGCSTLYISSGENVDTVQAKLGTFGFKSDDPKQLRIVTSHQWYTPDGNFDAGRVVDQYRRLIDEALDNGFAGLYVSADASDTLDYLSKKGMVEAWMDYEHSLGTTFKFPMEAICAFNAEQIKSNGQLLFQLVKDHKHTISLKSETRISNEQLLRSTVYRQLKTILGETTTTLFFDYLENYISAQNRPLTCDVGDLLQPILREGHSSIEQNILEDIYARIEL
ncbi:MAG: MEDS domain-containing protein [Candidatus Bathyarchaeota archaeon]|nr:MEDS domain-containing protein [Candidatus Bathyarchaeota archaeon]